MAVLVLGENMVVHGKDVLKLCLGFVLGGILKRAFCQGMWTLLKVGL